jgi:hypothetical protein
MSNRYIRNLVILAKAETTYNTDPTPAANANAILVSDVNLNPLNAQNVPRDLIRAFFGSSEQLVGVRYLEMSFTVELAGSGAAGTAPAWGPLLKACMFAEDVEAGEYVAYSPITDSAGSVTIHWYDSGVRHIGLGGRGNVEITAKVGERPVMRFSFKLLCGVVSAQAVPAADYTAWIKPLIPTDTNTDDLLIGGTYADGAVTGGTAFPSTGLELNMGNQIEFTPLIGAETIDGVDREATGKILLDLTAAQEVTFKADVEANTLKSISMEHGQAAGNTILLHLASAQLLNWRKEEINKKRMVGYDLRLVPTAGNDELVIVAK